MARTTPFDSHFEDGSEDWYFKETQEEKQERKERKARDAMVKALSEDAEQSTDGVTLVYGEDT